MLQLARMDEPPRIQFSFPDPVPVTSISAPSLLLLYQYHFDLADGVSRACVYEEQGYVRVRYRLRDSLSFDDLRCQCLAV